MATEKKRYKKDEPAVDISGLVYGKVPPQAVQIEEVILGTILLEPDSIDVVVEILPVNAFYSTQNRHIYNAIFELNKSGLPVDTLTVVEKLKQTEVLEAVGGPYYVMQLTNSVVSSANIERHCQIVKQKYLAREMITLCIKTVQSAYSDAADVFEVIADHERDLTQLVSGSISAPYVTVDTALVKTLGAIEKRRSNTSHLVGVTSGQVTLDRATHGWQAPDLIILAARPAVGKTAFALSLCMAASMNDIKVVPSAFFSLEMSTEQLVERMLSATSEIYLERIKTGNMEDGDMKVMYEKGINKLARAPIYLDDTASLTIYEFRAKCRRIVRAWLRLGLDKGPVFIDYLQLMSGSGKASREQEISEISRGLKLTAKELNVPIIALSQLSRAVESRKGDVKMPQLSDLRESGAIEQDADMVMFLYRPEYYDIQSNENGQSTRGETHLKIAKHRNGSLDTLKFRAELSIQKFYTWDDGNAFMIQPGRSSGTKFIGDYLPHDEAPF